LTRRARNYLCYGYDADRRRFLCQNSWGRAGGDDGRFRIHRIDLDRLIVLRGAARGAAELFLTASNTNETK